ncbi:MAG: glycosyltransferase family 8 protein [Solobacterium sp.]|nr:glycosyltransferase family 8 protein [Solobacterium sp.]
MRRIPVVFSVDNDYLPILATSVRSMLLNSGKDYFYEINVFYTDVSDYRRKLFCSDLEGEHFSVSFIDVSAMLSEKGIISRQVAHLSIASMFRLFIPELLPQYDKVIYLDSDIVVTGDISELFAIDLGDCYLGAADDGFSKYLVDYWETVLGIRKEKAFNAGVLLINNRLFRSEHISERCLLMLIEDQQSDSPKYAMMDQDVLNLVCGERRKRIPLEWNFEYQYQDGAVGSEVCFHSKELSEASLAPKLIHYAGIYKPWNHPELHYAEIFWKYARCTSFYEELICIMQENRQKEIRGLFKNYHLPFAKKVDGTAWVLYGAGNVGQIIMKQIKHSDISKPIAWVDRDHEKYTSKGLKVSPITILTQGLNYSYIVLAVKKAELAESINRSLIESGIPGEKILWESPLIDTQNEK